jgi:phage shock protein PspC (stress-responsive transcriptional regulator)
MTQPSDQPPPEPSGQPTDQPKDQPSTEAKTGTGTAGQDTGAARPVLLRAPRQKVVAGVCGGLGRYCDVDPVIFRIVIGLLSVTGGIGLIFYGFAWLLIPLDGEDENEARRLLSGRVEGAALIAVLLALIGCGLFLSMLSNGGTLSFAAMLSVAVIGSAVWSQHRRAPMPPGGPKAPSVAYAGTDAPPETKAPPTPFGSPSWWRDPIIKDGTTGPLGSSGYLWGPDDSPASEAPAGPRMPWPGRRRGGHHGGHHDRRHGGSSRSSARTGHTHDVSGLISWLALLAGGLGVGLSWGSHPLGTSLEIGLTADLAVFALGLIVTAFAGRTGVGTIFMTAVTAGLLAAATVIPKDIPTSAGDRTWHPASVAAVHPRYDLGLGAGTLDLRGLTVPKGQTVSTRAGVGAGLLKVEVPAGLTVKIRVETGLGDVRLPGQQNRGLDVSPNRVERRTLAPHAGADPAGTLVLRLEVGVGQVEVRRATS